jgi:hypothetical protein
VCHAIPHAHHWLGLRLWLQLTSTVLGAGSGEVKPQAPNGSRCKNEQAISTSRTDVVYVEELRSNAFLWVSSNDVLWSTNTLFLRGQESRFSIGCEHVTPRLIGASKHLNFACSSKPVVNLSLALYTHHRNFHNSSKTNRNRLGHLFRILYLMECKFYHSKVLHSRSTPES